MDFSKSILTMKFNYFILNCIVNSVFNYFCAHLVFLYWFTFMSVK